MRCLTITDSKLLVIKKFYRVSLIETFFIAIYDKIIIIRYQERKMEYIIIFLLICVVSYYRNEKNDLEINLNDAHEKLKRVNSSDRYYREKLQEADSYYKNKLNETEMFCKSRIDMITAECNNRYAEIRQNEKLLRDLINSKVKDFPIVADVIAELKSSIDKNRSYYLEFKKRPAPKAAEMIMEVRLEKKELVKQKLALEWEMKYIRRLLPWIDEIEDNPMEPINQSSDYYNKNYNMEDSNKDDIDNAGYWLTPKEYQSLTNIQKYQLALDRYNKNVIKVIGK